MGELTIESPQACRPPREPPVAIPGTSSGHSGYLQWPFGRTRHRRLESCRRHVGVISDLHDAYLVEANTSAATCQQEADGIGQNF